MRGGINYVGVKLDLNKGISFNGGELYADKTFNPNEYVSLKGEVVALPIKLDMDWVVDDGLQEGDIVHIDYHEALMALGNSFDAAQEGENPRWFKEGDDTIVFVRYEFLYYFERDGKRIMMNGYIEVEPVFEKLESDTIIVNEYKKTVFLRGEIINIGAKATYKHYNVSEMFIGDTIVYKAIAVRNVGNMVDKGIVIVQSRFVVGKVK